MTAAIPVTIHSPSMLHSQSRPLCVLSRSCGAKIAHLMEVPASQSDEKQSHICLQASLTHLCARFSSTVNSNIFWTNACNIREIMI